MAPPTYPQPRPVRAMTLALGAGIVALAGRSFAEVPLFGAAGAPTADAWRAAAAAGPANPELRVLLQQAPVIEPLAWGGPLRLRDGQGRELLLLAAGERLRISRAADLLRLERSGGALPTPQAPLQLPLQSLQLEPAPVSTAAGGPPESAGGAGLVGLGRRAYRGVLLVRPASGGLMALNLIPLELYLPSVVGSEMPARWPAEALRAQAVAARTYALIQLKPAAAFDLKATVASQAYLGVEAETDTTRAAVAATQAQVLRFGGALIDAVFHSSSGGSTENSGDLWPRQLPYLVSVPEGDDRSPWRQWSQRFDSEQLRQAFRETAGVRRIEVLAASGTGRVRLARVIGPAGSLDLSGGELRQRLGLRSTLVRFRFEDPPAGASGDALNPPGAGEPGTITSATASARAIARARARAADPLSGATSPAAPAGSSGPGGQLPATAAALPPPPPPLPPLPSAAPTASLPAAAASAAGEALAPPLQPPLPSLEVLGRGFGHGVGMSQWGAYAMALRGLDHGAILRHYYQGVELVRYSGR
ncbi:MAG: SpoIID/LytB domain-containing protein [Cyanobium sp.]